MVCNHLRQLWSVYTWTLVPYVNCWKWLRDHTTESNSLSTVLILASLGMSFRLAYPIGHFKTFMSTCANSEPIPVPGAPQRNINDFLMSGGISILSDVKSSFSVLKACSVASVKCTLSGLSFRINSVRGCRFRTKVWNESIVEIP